MLTVLIASPDCFADSVRSICSVLCTAYSCALKIPAIAQIQSLKSPYNILVAVD